MLSFAEWKFRFTRPAVEYVLCFNRGGTPLVTFGSEHLATVGRDDAHVELLVLFGLPDFDLHVNDGCGCV